MKYKRILSALLCAALLVSLCVTGAAAAAESYDTFDYRAYANIYPDLKAAYGYNAEKLYAHYVNYGRAEGRVGSFIDGSNPKTDAPIYGTNADARFATVLNPIPPTTTSKQPDWAQNQVVGFRDMSNVRLVAEYISSKAYMDEAWAARKARDNGAAFNEKEYWLNDTVQRYAERIEQELLLRVRAVEENRPDLSTGAMGKVGERAMASDTTILRQWGSKYEGLSAPPADPGKAGEKPAATVGGFSDVTEKDYFAQSVLWAVEKKITSGTSATTFSPGQTCTQAQILTFLWRSQGSPEPEGTVKMNGFDGTEYYYKAVQWAAEQDMIKGDFDPSAPCTRALAVTFLWKQAGSPSAPAASFTDVPAEAEFAPAVAWAVEKGVTSGTGNNQFSPAQTCTRGQIMTFLYRAFAG